PVWAAQAVTRSCTRSQSVGPSAIPRTKPGQSEPGLLPPPGGTKTRKHAQVDELRTAEMRIRIRLAESAEEARSRRERRWCPEDRRSALFCAHVRTSR